MEVDVDKHGYEQERSNENVKTAAEKGRCPICGAETTGSPPVCPNHGSEPFEKRPSDGEEED
jgi:hypothetical protein